MKKIAVQVAFLEGDRLAVSSGLENVRQVVTKGVGYLTDKSIVKPVADTDSLTK